MFHYQQNSSQDDQTGKTHFGFSGQIGVVVVLIMSVILTVGLSVASNTTRDVELTRQETESNRVFNAAEAGIEEALSSDFNFEGDSTSGTVSTIGDVGVNYNVDKVRRLETRLFEGVGVSVDLTGATTGQALQIDFSRQNDCGTEEPASVRITIYFDDAGTTRSRTVGVAGCDRSDGFTLASNINIDGYRRRATVPVETGDLFASVSPLYNDTHIRVQGSGWTLPVQGYSIRSEAESTLGDETRIVQVNRSLPTAPNIFDYVMFSGAGIVK